MESVRFGPVGRGPKGRFVSIKGNPLLGVPVEINMEVASAPILPSVEIGHGSISPLPVCSSLETSFDNCCLEETMSMERDGLNGFKGSLDKDCDHVSPSCCKGSGGAAIMLNRDDVLGNMMEQNMDYSSKVPITIMDRVYGSSKLEGSERVEYLKGLVYLLLTT